MDEAQDKARTVVEQVTAAVDYLRISVGPAPADEHWLPCGQLVEDPEALLALVRTTAATRGTNRDDVAVSLFVQGYAFRIASLAIGAWLLADSVMDVAPATTSIAIGRGRPNAVRLAEARLVPTDDPLMSLHETLIDAHAAILVDTAHRACRVGEALLWANVGASCASSFGAFMDPLVERRADVRERIERFFAAARPELRRAGRVVRVGSRWAWERKACCLWYQTESGFLCEDCSLHSEEDRRARYTALVAEETAS